MVSTGKKAFFSLLACSLMASGLQASAHAAEYEYPELTVTPRASERLEMEARHERANRYTAHLPIQVSALTTLVASLIQSGDKDVTKDPDGRAPMAGSVVGGAWLAATLALSALHEPYSPSWNEVSALPHKTAREQLFRERLSEEALEREARLARRLTWLSVATNAGASIYLLTKTHKDSFSMVADGVALAAAFTPLVFQSRWVVTANEQQDYKKKIYAPIASFGPGLIPHANRQNAAEPAPGLLVSLNF